MGIRLKVWQWNWLHLGIVMLITTPVIMWVISAVVPEAVATPPTSMVMIEKTGHYQIWQHKETGCHYIETGGSSGSFNVMVTPEGLPFCK